METKCNQCENPATFVAPKDLCDVCWANWWVDGILEGSDHSVEFRENLLKETIENMKRE